MASTRFARPTLGNRVSDGSSRIGRLAVGLSLGVVTLSTVAACGSSSNGTAKASSASSVLSSAMSTANSSAGAGSMSASMSTSRSMSATGQSAAEIHIDKFTFTTPASVSPGAMVSVMNMDGEAHTVTADSGNTFDDMAIAGKTTMFKAPDKPGSYPFHCTYHSNMHGVLVVK